MFLFLTIVAAEVVRVRSPASATARTPEAASAGLRTAVAHVVRARSIESLGAPTKAGALAAAAAPREITTADPILAASRSRTARASRRARTRIAALARKLLLRASLARRRRSPPRGAAIAVRDRLVWIRGTLAMLRVMLPGVVTGVDVTGADVSVVNVGIVVVDDDGAVVPPAATLPPGTSDRSTHGYPDAEREG
jgi:hypothetical protein